jgi:CO dehydrogenase maturation factor
VTPIAAAELWPGWQHGGSYDRAMAGLRIAVVGKGGAGKSVIAGTLARVMARRGNRVLTLDSDLMPGLSMSLGLGPTPSAMLTDAVEKNEEGRWRLRKGIGPVRAVERYADVAPDGIRHLQCGKFDADGMPKIIGSVNGFYQVVQRIPRAPAFDDWTIIGDLPAGPRQLAFRWASYATTFLVVVEPSWKSALTAKRIASIIRSEPGREVLAVASKVNGAAERRQVEDLLGEAVAGSIPLDAAVGEAERAGVAPIDHAPSSLAIRAIEALADTLAAPAARKAAA